MKSLRSYLSDWFTDWPNDSITDYLTAPVSDWCASWLICRVSHVIAWFHMKPSIDRPVWLHCRFTNWRRFSSLANLPDTFPHFFLRLLITHFVVNSPSLSDRHYFYFQVGKSIYFDLSGIETNVSGKSSRRSHKQECFTFSFSIVFVHALILHPTPIKSREEMEHCTSS